VADTAAARFLFAGGFTALLEADLGLASTVFFFVLILSLLLACFATGSADLTVFMGTTPFLEVLVSFRAGTGFETDFTVDRVGRFLCTGTIDSGCFR